MAFEKKKKLIRNSTQISASLRPILRANKNEEPFTNAGTKLGGKILGSVPQ